MTKKLSPARALNLLVHSYPVAFTAEELARGLGMAARGGGYLTLLRHLKRNGLVEMQGKRLRAGSVLFP